MASWVNTAHERNRKPEFFLFFDSCWSDVCFTSGSKGFIASVLQGRTIVEIFWICTIITQRRKYSKSNSLTRKEYRILKNFTTNMQDVLPGYHDWRRGFGTPAYRKQYTDTPNVLEHRCIQQKKMITHLVVQWKVDRFVEVKLGFKH